MRFTHEGVTYEIEFERFHKQVHLHDKLADEKKGNKVRYVKSSSYPYTTVRLLVVSPDTPKKEWKVYRNYTVGCFGGINPDGTRDKFTYDKGRKTAISLMLKGKELSKDFKRAVWDCYRGVTAIEPENIKNIRTLNELAARYGFTVIRG